MKAKHIPIICALLVGVALAVTVAVESQSTGSPYNPRVGTVTAEAVTVDGVTVPQIYAYRNFSSTCATDVLQQPAGWVVSCNNYSTGNYTITHNWGSTDYNCTANVAGTITAGRSVSFSNMGANAFTVHITLISSHAANSDPWQVTCFRYS